MKAPTQTEIARELGITKAALSKLKLAGMPVHSADAARAWRSANLHPGRVRPDPGPSPRTLVERLHALWPLAAAALAAGRFHLVADEVRSALRAVPESHRDLVLVEPSVMDALLGPHVIAELRGDGGGCQAVGAGSDDEGASAADQACVGSLLYALACGEVRLRRPGEPLATGERPWSPHPPMGPSTE
jgi:hypothetical protein